MELRNLNAKFLLYLLMKDELAKVLAILYLLSEYRRLGRYQISKMLRLGEGVVRRILKELKETGFVTSLRGGSSLTLKGKKLLRGLLETFKVKKIVKVNVADVVGPGYLGVGVCCRTSCSDVLKIRDEVVRGGAEGALVLKFEGGELKMPYINGKELLEISKFMRSVSNLFKLSEGDIIIIGFDKEFGRALIGVIKAVLLFHEPVN